VVGLARLGDAAVHVWQVRLDGGADPDVRDYQRILAPDEVARAARFVFERDRRRFVVARAALRQVLAAYLELAPDRLEFAYGVRGKPELRAPPGSAGLRFNVAHSAALGLIGVARRSELGIDVEYARAMPDALSIAEHYFSRPERIALSSAEGGTREHTFFTYWTRKEAVLKATGDGLSVPLDRVDVAWTGADAAHRIVVHDLSGTRHHLHVLDLEPVPGYVGALAFGGDNAPTVQPRAWPDDLVRVYGR